MQNREDNLGPSPSDGGTNDASREIRRQYLAAQKAGERDEVIEQLSESKLYLPIAIDHPQSALDEHVIIVGYDIREEISRGGQARVFDAIHEATGRRVAIKVMTGGPFLTSRNRARFEREINILASLQHRGIVQVIDAGRTSDGSFFFAMEFVEGECLDTYLETRRLEGWKTHNVLRLFVEICDALEEAHRRNIIHRDLKPSNIRIDRNGNPHILDFGLAHLLEHDVGEPTITQTGHIVGSMPWASPEQAIGNIKAMGPQSDVYSLAVVLYCILTSDFPYPVLGPLHEMLRHIVETTARSPLDAQAQPFGMLDGQIAIVLMEALAKDPKQRPASAKALGNRLDDYLAGRATKLSYRAHSGLFKRAIATPRRSGVIVALVTMAALAAVAGVAIYRRDARPHVSVAHLARLKNALGIEFVKIPAGSFTMGATLNDVNSAKEQQTHHVILTKSYYMAVTEVTREQYRTVMGTVPNESPGKDDTLPVDFVTWHDATEFCLRLSKRDGQKYRLPTEAEWEFACRSGSPSRYAGTGNIEQVAWHAGNSDGKLHPVGQLQPNDWGLYDMEGNVAEWCHDGYFAHLGHDEAIDPTGLTDQEVAVVRGGSYRNSAKECTSSARSALNISVSVTGVGFRIVLDAATAPKQ